MACLAEISALFAGAAAATVAAEGPAAASATVALLPDDADEAWIEFGRQADALWIDRCKADDDLAEALRRFDDLAGETPPALLCLDNDHPGAPHYRSAGLIKSELLLRDLPDYSPRSRFGRWMRRTLKIAEAYEEQVRRASRDSGLDEVHLRIVGLDQDIRELVPEVFAYTPVTAAGCAAQARCFLLAYEWARDPASSP